VSRARGAGTGTQPWGCSLGTVLRTHPSLWLSANRKRFPQIFEASHFLRRLTLLPIYGHRTTGSRGFMECTEKVRRNHRQ
jgi:hypothetical protein